MRVHRIKPDQAKRRLDADEPVLFVDARAPKEYERSNEQLPGAVRIPADKVADHLQELPRDRTIITYCT